MRGISPLVAVVMLIAFTLIVAGVLAGFVTQLTETKQASIEHCMDAAAMLKKGTYDPASENLSLTIYNYGGIPLSFQALLTYSNESRHGGIDTIISDEKFYIEDGNINKFNIENVTDDLIEVTIKSVKCDPPCYECSGVQDLLKYSEIRGIGY